jgi:hypothetical protein
MKNRNAPDLRSVRSSFLWQTGEMYLHSRSYIKLAVFNICFAVLQVILFSPGLADLGSKPVAAVITAALSVGAFFGVNYWLLNDQPLSVQSGKLRDAQDYRDALESWKSAKNPFNQELSEAVHQLDLFHQKNTALKALLGDQAKEPGNPYLSITEDVEECLFANMKKLINRMTILDLEDGSRFPMHHEFIRGVLDQNRNLLTQYDNLIIEISQIGDSAVMDDLHLDSITEALRELRDSTPAPQQLQQAQQSGEE